MLIDDIKEFENETPHDIIMNYGICKFCGQMAQIKTLIEWDSGTRNEAAIELCECPEAKHYAFQKNRKEKAHRTVEKYFGSKSESRISEDIVELIKTSIELIISDLINSVTIDIGNGLKAKVSVTSKDFIKVERIKTIKASEET